MKIGLTLSGGGARGITHLGVIQALEEMGLEFSVLSGASAGSIVGSLYSYGYRPKQILEIIQKISVFKSVRPSWTFTGLLSLDGLRDVLSNHMTTNSFEALKKPMYIAITNLKKGTVEYISSGELITTIMASCCVPAIFSPININGNIYVDGGVLDNLPAKPIKDKCDLLIGVSCNPIGQDFDPKNIKMVMERTLLMAINTNTLISRSLCDVFIEPPGLSNITGFEIGKAQDIYEIGYEFTRKNFSIADFKPKT